MFTRYQRPVSHSLPKPGLAGLDAPTPTEALPPAALPGIPADRVTWTLKDWEANDPDGLKALRKKHHATVAQLKPE